MQQQKAHFEYFVCLCCIGVCLSTLIIESIRQGMQWVVAVNCMYTEQSWFHSRQGLAFFLPSPKNPDRLWRPLSLLFTGHRDHFPGPNVTSQPSIAKANTEWSHTYTSRYSRTFMACIVRIQVLLMRERRGCIYISIVLQVGPCGR